MFNERGFTITEVLAAVGIAGVLLGMGVASTSAVTTRVTFEGNKVQFRDILQQARNFARNKQECVQVQVNGTLVSVRGYVNMSTPCVGFVATNIDPASLISVNFDPSIAFTAFQYGASTTNTLVFNTQGGTDYSSAATTTITQANFGSTYTILPLLGQIESN